jgi:hypothetical protein
VPSRLARTGARNGKYVDVLSGMAIVYRDQTRSDEAESLLKRGLEIHGKADGRNAPQGGLDPRDLGLALLREGEGGRQWDRVALTTSGQNRSVAGADAQAPVARNHLEPKRCESALYARISGPPFFATRCGNGVNVRKDHERNWDQRAGWVLNPGSCGTRCDGEILSSAPADQCFAAGRVGAKGGRRNCIRPTIASRQ